MGNRQGTLNRNNGKSHNHIPKASSTPTFSSNMNLEEVPTTIKVTSKTSPKHIQPLSASPTTLKQSTSSKSKYSVSSNFEPTTIQRESKAASFCSSHYPNTTTPSSATSIVGKTNTTSKSSDQATPQQQPDIRSGNSTPTAKSHPSSTDSIVLSPKKPISPTFASCSQKPISLNNTISISTLNNNSTPSQSKATSIPSKNSSVNNSSLNQKASSPPSLSNQKWNSNSSEDTKCVHNQTTEEAPKSSKLYLLEPTSVKSNNFMQVESVEDFSALEDNKEVKTTKEELHHSVTLPEMALPDFSILNENEFSADSQSRQRSNSLSASSRSKPVFLAIQNNAAHVSSRRKLKVSIPQATPSPLPTIELSNTAVQFGLTIEKEQPIVNKEPAKQVKVPKLKLVQKKESISSTTKTPDAPLFSPVASTQTPTTKTKKKGSSTTKIETQVQSLNNTSTPTMDDELSRTSISNNNTMTKSLFASADERKSFCSAALDFQKNWFNDLMGRRELVTVEQHSDSLHNPAQATKSSSNIYSQHSKSRACPCSPVALFDTRRRHSVFESKNITAVPLIAVSCPPNPAQSLDVSNSENSGKLLSVNAEKKARIAKKKRSLNNSPKKSVSASVNYSNLSSYKMKSKKSK